MISSLYLQRLTVDPDNIIQDARIKHSIDPSWDVIYAQNKEIFAMLFFDTGTDSAEYIISVYENNNSIFKKYYFSIGGTFGDISAQIESMTISDFSILFSLNTLSIPYIECRFSDSNSDVLITNGQPFIFIIPYLQSFSYANKIPQSR